MAKAKKKKCKTCDELGIKIPKKIQKRTLGELTADDLHSIERAVFQARKKKGGTASICSCCCSSS